MTLCYHMKYHEMVGGRMPPEQWLCAAACIIMVSPAPKLCMAVLHEEAAVYGGELVAGKMKGPKHAIVKWAQCL